MTTFFAAVDAGQARPLCTHYLSAHFDDLRVYVFSEDGGARELKLIWAMAVLRDGDWEVLGVWAMSTPGVAFWSGMLDEFTARGCESLSIVLAEDVADVRAVFPSATVLPPFGRTLSCRHVSTASDAGRLRAKARHAVRDASSTHGAHLALERLLTKRERDRAAVLAPDWSDVLSQLGAFYALRPQRRALVRRGDDILNLLSSGLARAIGRHGPFADSKAATSFVTEALTRAERRLSVLANPMLPMPAYPPVLVAVRAGAGAPGH